VLTDGVDEFTGAAGNDTFNATGATLTAFDAIDGGAGTDALNLTFTAAAFDFDVDAAGATVAGVENVRINAAAVNVTGDISGWTGVETVTVNIAGASADVNLATAASNSVTITGSRDIAIEDATATTVSITANDADDSEDDIVGVTAAAMTTLTLNVAEGTVVTLDTESTALTINAAGMNDTDGIAGNVDITVIDASAAAAAGIVTDLTINVTSDSALDLDFAQATTLAVTGSADLTLTETDLNDVESVTVAGSAGLTGDLSGMAALESIVSTSTGDIDVTIAATALGVTTGDGDDTIIQAAALGATQAINTGAGDDVVDLGAVPTAGATVNGGDGTDTIAVVSASVGTNHSAVISNFEVLRVDNALNVNLNVANFDAIQTVILGGDGAADSVDGDRTITGALSGFSLEFQAAATAGTDDTTVTVTNAVTTDDVVNVTFNAAATADYGSVIVANVETINVNSTTTDDDPTTVINTVGLTIAAADTLNVTGDAELVLDLAMTSLETVAAADFDADLTVDLTGNANDVTVTVGDGDNDVTGGGGADTITVGDGNNTIDGGADDDIITAGDGDNVIDGGADDDIITTGSGDDTIVGGAGDDTIVAGNGANTITGGLGADTMTGGTGVDTYIFAVVADSQGVTVDTITNFDADEDVLDFSAVSVGVGAYLGETSGYGSVLTSLSGGGATEAVLDTSTNTLYVDINGDGALTVADMAVQLTGVTALDATNFVL
jgi:Ca2+-binding RTX toxin-like protein